MLNKGTASLEVSRSHEQRADRELENFASLEPRVCEVLLYKMFKSIPLYFFKKNSYSLMLFETPLYIISVSDNLMGPFRIIELDLGPLRNFQNSF